jgi:DNA-binding NarL/FixJ family response regulator
MPDESSRTSGQHSVSSHVSQHTSSHAAPLRSEHTPAQVPLPPPAAALPDPSPAPFTTAALRVVVADDNPVVRAGLSVLLTGRADIEVVAEAADGRQAYEMAQQHQPDVVLLDVRMPGVDGISVLPYLVQVAPVVMLTYSRESEIVREALRLGAGGYLVHGEFTAEQLVGAIRDIKEGRAPFTATAASALLAQVRDGVQQQSLPEGLGQSYASTLPHSGGDQAPAAPYQQVPTAHGVPPQPPQSWPSGSSQQAVPDVSGPPNPGQSSSQMQRDVAGWSGQLRNRAEFGLSSREAEVMDLIASGMSNQQIAATCFISEKTVKNHINRIFAKLHSASRSEAVAVWLGTVRGTGNGGNGKGLGGHD